MTAESETELSLRPKTKNKKYCNLSYNINNIHTMKFQTRIQKIIQLMEAFWPSMPGDPRDPGDTRLHSGTLFHEMYQLTI